MGKTIVFKYGGNAMLDPSLRDQVIRTICSIKAAGNRVVVSHGGGPFIREMLEMAGVSSEFVDGQRRTTAEAMPYIEMVLKGRVNGELVGMINRHGERAVGLSGKDGMMVRAVKRRHWSELDGARVERDLGQVGDVGAVDTELLELLLGRSFLPVVACVAADDRGVDMNINGDVFAGALAGALTADEFVVMTDVDGLLREVSDPGSLIRELSVEEVGALIRSGVIAGGMIPKMEACCSAIATGARSVRIINGTKPEQLKALRAGEDVGTRIRAV